jgi:REP element-mobilizing transposase RayT
MADTYSRIYIQLVFAVKGRQCLIHHSFREELQKYISGIIEKRNTKLIAIYCMPDHAHLLIGMKPSISLSDLVRDIKAGSSKFINDNRLVKEKFEWQMGFGAFSYGHSQLDIIIRYINNQEAHHIKNKFKDEYVLFLKKIEIDYNPDYIFE